MKRYILILLYFCFCFKTENIQAQNLPFFGYDNLSWGTSSEIVKKKYSITNESTSTKDSLGNSIQKLTQNNVSEMIYMREFEFIDNKLFRVYVTYNNADDTTYETLRRTLTGNYGSQTGTDLKWEETILPVASSYIIYGKYSPDIYVELIRTAYINGYGIKICYTWKRFLDERNRSNIEL